VNFPAPVRNADGAVAALVLGILGIVACPLCAPFAWSMGAKAERAVDSSGGTFDGRGMATAGKILGIVGTVLLGLAVLFLLALLVLGVGLIGFGGSEIVNGPSDVVTVP